MNTRKPIRILRLITRLNVGGPAQHVVWLTAAMNDGRFATQLIAGTISAGEQDMSDFAAAHGVSPVLMKEMGRELSLADGIAVWKAYRAMLRFRPDVVHTHTAKAGTVGRLAGLLYRYATLELLVGRPRQCRFIHTYHGHIFHSYYGRWKTLIFLTIERLLARIATDRIVVLSEQQLREIRDQFHVGRADQYTLVPLGIDLEHVRGSAESRSAARAGLRLASSEMVVGIVGRLTPIKNHELFLRVAAQCGDAARFVIYGDGAERERLEMRAVELACDDRVIFAGTRKPSDIYATIDILALTSRNEGTPLALIEGMANGLPIVSTRVGGVVDLLGEVQEEVVEADARYEIRERGLTVASDDELGFSAALQRLLRDRQLRDRVARAGIDFVQKRHSKHHLIENIELLTVAVMYPTADMAS